MPEPRAMPKRPNVLWGFRLAVAAGLLLFLILHVGPAKIGTMLADVHPLWALGAAACAIVQAFLGSLTLWILLSAVHPLSFSRFFRKYIYSYTLMLVTPGQMGDASLILFLKKEGIARSSSAAIYTVDKIISMGVFFGVAWWGAGTLLPEVNTNIFLLLPLTAVLLLTMGLAGTKYLSGRLKILSRIKGWIDEAEESLRLLKGHRRRLALVGLLAVGKWIFMSGQYFLAFLAFRQLTAWPAIGIIPILASLVGYIPVSLGGIGTVEITAIYLFNRQGLATPVILTVYLFLRMVQFLMSALLVLGLGDKARPSVQARPDCSQTAS